MVFHIFTPTITIITNFFYLLIFLESEGVLHNENQMFKI